MAALPAPQEDERGRERERGLDWFMHVSLREEVSQSGTISSGLTPGSSLCRIAD